jgi:thermitase
MATTEQRSQRRRAHFHFRSGWAATLLPAIFGASAAWAIPPERSSEGPWAKGQILVTARAGAAPARLEALARSESGAARRLGASNVYVFELPAHASERAAVARLARHPLLKTAELDRAIPVAAVANDPQAASAWHLGKIGAGAAWDTTQGAGVTIAIIDSGVDESHPDLAAQLVPGWNFYDNNATTTDVHGHGTAVAGAAAATTNNAVGVASVAGQARIMPLRVADSTGYAYYSKIASAITYAADRGVRVANASFIGAAGSSSIQSAAAYMKSKGGLVFVCAGNNGIDEGFAPSTSLIAVSATDSADVKTSWSSYGSFVALSAPGLGILTTNRGGGYGSWWGTSFASPISSAVAALVMSAKPSLSSSDVERVLFSTAVDLGAAGRDGQYGHGRVNAAAAVAAALGTGSTADSLAPSLAVPAPLDGSVVTGQIPVDVSATDNVGVAKVELRVNGSLVGTDTTAPYGFSWDTTKLANGNATLAVTAYDAAGNAASQSVGVTVSNVVAVDTTPPVVTVLSPGNGSSIVGTSVTVSASASDNAGAAGITQTLYIDGKVVASATGGSLSYKWNTRKLSAGTHTVQVVARDATGNTGGASIQVQK